jgi:thioesterase-3
MHTHSIIVRGFHLDAYGHVNNARYLEYLEEARWEFFKDCGGTLHELEKLNIGLFLVRLESDFRKPSFLDDRLQVLTKVIKVGSRSLVFEQKIIHHSSRDIVIEAVLTGAVVNLKTQKSMYINEETRPIFNRMLEYTTTTNHQSTEQTHHAHVF